MTDAEKLEAMLGVLRELQELRVYLNREGRWADMALAESGALRRIATIAGFDLPLSGRAESGAATG